MFFRQVLHADLGCASYVIADGGEAAVVDPRWDIGVYLDLALERDARVTRVIETHNHADHLSGRERLVQATGATSHVHRLARATYPHEGFQDGDEIRVGEVVLRVLHTPGHRPEHSAIVVIDSAQSPLPFAVLTGDSLFVHDAARPDLAVEPREGALDLHASLTRLAELGDGVAVYPGHTGGSLCGSRRMGETTSSTIGYERATNPLLAIDDAEEFSELLIGDLPPQPPNFAAIAERNRTGNGSPFRPPAVLAAGPFAERIAAGGLVIDGRAPADYDAAHVPGSVGVTLESAGFGTKAAWISEGRPLLLVGYDDAMTEHMALLLAAVGLDEAAESLAGGFEAWRAAGMGTDRVAIVTVAELGELRRSQPDLQVLDVREHDEWEEQRIPGSAHVPYHDLARIPPPLDPAAPVAVICSTGTRSALAVGLVRRAGFAEVIHVSPGGVGTWAALGLPTEGRERSATA
jgi:glyoxylase-like metal-dependent hydrolase (beta-lactamase superfamily II)/rhodanese-related sulfurtransferase